MESWHRLLVVLWLVGALGGTAPAHAEDRAKTTETAATRILFEYGADDFAVYRVREDGYLLITFARNTPDALYSEILGKLQTDPGVHGVIASKGGAYCPLFR